MHFLRGADLLETAARTTMRSPIIRAWSQVVGDVHIVVTPARCRGVCVQVCTRSLRPTAALVHEERRAYERSARPMATLTLAPPDRAGLQSRWGSGRGSSRLTRLVISLLGHACNLQGEAMFSRADMCG